MMTTTFGDVVRSVVPKRNVDLNDGSHWFYSSAAEFEKGKAKYQQWLEQQRQEKRAEQANANALQ